MNIFKWFFNLFKSKSPEERAVRINNNVEPVDVMEVSTLVNRLEIVINGEENQEQNVGYQIKHEINKYSNSTAKRAASDLKHSDIELNKCKIDSDVYHDLINAYKDKSSELIEKDKHELTRLHRDLEDKKQELDRFKTKNKLERTAHYPSRLALFFKVFVVLFLVIVEGFANASFFAQGSDQGLVGGFASAFTCAAVNVLIAFLLGWHFVRFVNHRNAFKKSFGFLSTLAAIVLMIYIALGIAHYRHAMMQLSDNPAKTALETFLRQPFELGDIMGWLLFGISILFALIALFDGLSMNDAYPGYGKLKKRFDKAQEKVDALNVALHDDIIEIKDDFSQQLDEFYQKTQEKLKDYAIFLNRKKEFKKRFDADNYQIETACKALLERYNVAKPWDDYLPDHVQQIEWHLEQDDAEYQTQLKAFEGFKAEKSRLISDIQSSFQKDYNALTTINDAMQVQQ